jgi:hypothetical protein
VPPDEQHSAGQQPQPVAAAGPREFGTAATGWVGDQIPQVRGPAGTSVWAADMQQRPSRLCHFSSKNYMLAMFEHQACRHYC